MLIATPSYTASLVDLGPRAWFTATGSGAAGCKLRKEASLTSPECGEARVGSRVRVDLMEEVDGAKVRMHICEPEPVGWTTAKFLTCDSGACGFCGKCTAYYKSVGATVLLPSQRSALREEALAKLEMERSACREEERLRQLAEREIKELEKELARLQEEHRAAQTAAAVEPEPELEEPPESEPRAVSLRSPVVAEVAREACKQLDAAMSRVDSALASNNGMLNPAQQKRIDKLKRRTEALRKRAEEHSRV